MTLTLIQRNSPTVASAFEAAEFLYTHGVYFSITMPGAGVHCCANLWTKFADDIGIQDSEFRKGGRRVEISLDGMLNWIIAFSPPFF